MAISVIAGRATHSRVTTQTILKEGSATLCVQWSRTSVRRLLKSGWLRLVAYFYLKPSPDSAVQFSSAKQLGTQRPSKLADADTASERAVRARGNTGPTEASRGAAGPTALHIHITLDQKAALHKPCHWQRSKQLLDAAKFHFVALPFVRVLFDCVFFFPARPTSKPTVYLRLLFGCGFFFPARPTSKPTVYLRVLFDWRSVWPARSIRKLATSLM